MTDVERAIASTDGWLTIKAPGQQGAVYIQDGDQVTLEFEPEEDDG